MGHRPDEADDLAAQLEREHASHRRRVLQAVGAATLPFPLFTLAFGGEIVTPHIVAQLVLVALTAAAAIGFGRLGYTRAGTLGLVAVGTLVAADAHVWLRESVTAPAYAILFVALGTTLLPRGQAVGLAFALAAAVLAMRVGRAYTGDGPEPWLPATVDVITLVGATAALGFTNRGRFDRDRELLYRAVDDLRRHQAALEEARATADAHAAAATAASEMKTEFLLRVSHELRTPLNAILGYGELVLESAEPSDPARADVERICVAARHQLHLVDELLDLSQVEAGRVDLKVEAIELAALVRPVADAARALARPKGLRVVVSAGAAMVRVDPGRVRQVLLNLVSNAVRFTDAGEVRIEAEVSGGPITLRVTDTGIGIGAERLAQLFQPFARAERAVGRGGAGLGLAITDRLVRGLGGTLAIASELGRGTRVEVTLPQVVDGATVSFATPRGG
ncbi:MAG: HAMP domain-containing sensor histidine kinase [Myxococcota bacterium]